MQNRLPHYPLKRLRDTFGFKTVLTHERAPVPLEPTQGCRRRRQDLAAFLGSPVVEPDLRRWADDQRIRGVAVVLRGLACVGGRTD